MKNHSNIYVQISEFPKKTGHKWKNLFYEQGKAGLCEQSRARLTQDMIDGDTAAELIRIKNAHLAWGPKKTREIYAKGCSFVIQR